MKTTDIFTISLIIPFAYNQGVSVLAPRGGTKPQVQEEKSATSKSLPARGDFP